MRATSYVVFGLVASIVVGCATTKVQTDFDRRATFRQLQTYQWVEQSPQTEGHPAVSSPLVAGRVQSAVDGHLHSRGYRRVDVGTPDFLIAYYVTTDQKVDLYTTNRSYRYGHRHYGYHRHSYGYRGYRRNYYGYGGPYLGSTNYADSYLEGTLVLDIIDAATGDVIWRGWATTDLDDNPKPREVERYVKMAVKKILDRFPPER